MRPEGDNNSKGCIQERSLQNRLSYSYIGSGLCRILLSCLKGRSDFGKAITMESPLCEIIIKGTKIQLPKIPLRTPDSKDFLRKM